MACSSLMSSACAGSGCKLVISESRRIYDRDIITRLQKVGESWYRAAAQFRVRTANGILAGLPEPVIREDCKQGPGEPLCPAEPVCRASDSGSRHSHPSGCRYRSQADTA